LPIVNFRLPIFLQSAIANRQSAIGNYYALWRTDLLRGFLFSIYYFLFFI